MFPYEILALIQPLWKHFWGHHQLLEGRFKTCCWWDFNSTKNFLSIPFCIMWIILKSSVTNDALQHHIHTPPTIGGPKSQTCCHTWYCWESNFQCYKHYAYTYIPVYLYIFFLLKMRTYRWANNRKSLMKRKFSFSLLIPGIKIKSLPLLCGVIFCILTSLLNDQQKSVHLLLWRSLCIIALTLSIQASFWYLHTELLTPRTRESTNIFHVYKNS